MELCAKGSLRGILNNAATLIGPALASYWLAELLEAIEVVFFFCFFLVVHKLANKQYDITEFSSICTSQLNSYTAISNQRISW